MNAMTAAEVQGSLAKAPGWSLIDGAIEKRFVFEDFHRTMAFVNAVAWVAHTHDHHPDLLVRYSNCAVRWSTHSVGGLSRKDFECAARVDSLLA
jgi:4a-hydroxytetrahydrobiopterin dehydratase